MTDSISSESDIEHYYSENLRRALSGEVSDAPLSVPEIAAALKAGAVVALPTETVYGLAISLASAPALKRLGLLKNRRPGSGKLFTLVPESFEQISEYAEIPDAYREELSSQIPGPLTAVLQKNPAFRHPYYDRLSKIGIRIPDYPLFAELLSLSGPLILTSANPRNLPVARTITEVRQYFGDGVLMPVDGGLLTERASKVVDYTTSDPTVLRH